MSGGLSPPEEVQGKVFNEAIPDEQERFTDAYKRLFEQYWDFVKQMVRRAGIVENEVDDVASELLLRFVERGYFAGYRENSWFIICQVCRKTTPWSDEVRECQFCSANIVDAPIKRSRFKGALRAFVSKALLNQLDKQGSRFRREILLCDVPLPDSGDNPPLWIEVYGPVYEPDSFPEYEDLVSRLEQRLEELPEARARDLALMFRTIESKARQDESVRRVEMAEILGKTESYVAASMRELRRILWEVGFAPGREFVV